MATEAPWQGAEAAVAADRLSAAVRAPFFYANVRERRMAAGAEPYSAADAAYQSCAALHGRVPAPQLGPDVAARWAKVKAILESSPAVAVVPPAAAAGAAGGGGGAAAGPDTAGPRGRRGLGLGAQAGAAAPTTAAAPLFAAATGSSGSGGGSSSAGGGSSSTAASSTGSTGMQPTSVAERMMARMNHKAGEGLGKTGQGAREAIVGSQKLGRTGLGFGSGGTEGAYVVQRRAHPLSDTDDPIRLTEDIEELYWEGEESDKPWADVEWAAGLRLGTVPGAATPEQDYDIFCDAELVQKMFAAKSRFDTVEKQPFLTARNAANPYEGLGKSIFMNRAAVKMANLDQLFNVTSPRCMDRGYLTFCDVCAGPGGFSEYILWRRQGIDTQGWGFTLEGDCDFRLERFRKDAPIACFETLYGKDNTGNIFREENLLDVGGVLALRTQGRGVDLVTADGGDSVAGRENEQEWLMRQLAVCQCAAALCYLKRGGTFVCKVFDVLTPFTAGLVYIMRLHFTKICLCKPLSSRPANSERYLVCKGFRCTREEAQPALQHLLRVNAALNAHSSGTGPDVLEIVPLARLLADKSFHWYLKALNVAYVEDQLLALQEILYYIEDPDRGERDRTQDLRQLLRRWKLPVPGEEGLDRPVYLRPQAAIDYAHQSRAQAGEEQTWHVQQAARQPSQLPPRVAAELAQEQARAAELQRLRAAGLATPAEEAAAAAAAVLLPPQVNVKSGAAAKRRRPLPAAASTSAAAAAAATTTITTAGAEAAGTSPPKKKSKTALRDMLARARRSEDAGDDDDDDGS